MKVSLINDENRLLHQMMDLAEKGHIQAIAPVKLFPFEDVLSAFRFMRGGNPIGKIVISNMNGFNERTKIPVSHPCGIVAVVKCLTVLGTTGGA